jgi:hypothetical protein
MFDDLGRQGLDANHPFAAYGDKEEAPRPGRLKSLLSLGRTPSVDKVRRACWRRRSPLQKTPGWPGAAACRTRVCLLFSNPAPPSRLPPASWRPPGCRRCL